MRRIPSGIPATAVAASLLVTIGPVPASAASDGALHCATVSARFVESAPRDRFEFSNPPESGVEILGLTLSLAGSVGELVFDTEDGGVGVEVFQPFRAESGDAVLARAVLPEDGGERIELTFSRFAPGERFVFSIDVDDRLADSELGQIRVSGSEIEQASLAVTIRDNDGAEHVQELRFAADARAVVASPACS